MFSLDGNTPTAEHLSSRPDALYLRMNELTMAEKSAAIRCYFAQYGKVLSENGFGNQVSAFDYILHRTGCLLNLKVYL